MALAISSRLGAVLLAAVLLISMGFTPWAVLIFPAWVFAISVAILVLNYRQNPEQKGQAGLSVDD